VPPLAGWWDAGDGVLLPPAVMAEVDRATVAGGVPGRVLMENAGRAVARAIVARFAPRPVVVFCGPGNNGGDGYVCARILTDCGWPVEVVSTVLPERLTGDAAWARSTWRGPLHFDKRDFEGGCLFVDALFGAGLTRDVDGAAGEAIRQLASSGGPVVAVDVPSGIDAATGVVRGAASPASLTVTFCRAKPGHVLLPARGLVGELVVADIGIPEAIVRANDIGLRVNAPSRWLQFLPQRTAQSHKYRHGHAVVVGGPAHATGACRLAARAALRVGAGLVSLACEPSAAQAYAVGTAALITRPIEGQGSLDAILSDERVTAVLIGPAAGVGTNTIEAVHAILSRPRGTVLDADALTSFSSARSELFARLHVGCVLTPHDGEYARLFNVQGDRLTRALAGAREAGAVVLLKGADTVVAAPDGRAAIQPAAPSGLATAGSGDVLAGLVLGLLAQGMPAFEAACAATWLHATAAAGSSGGIIADDLPDRVGLTIEARSALF
jgi:hydroxyethylthiazole kinase-like uncharacterized protein yjeF